MEGTETPGFAVQMLAHLKTIEGFFWGPLMLIALGATGLYLMFGLRFMPLRHIGEGFRLLWQGRKSQEEGDVPPFRALMTSLSATVGTGNIVGVATAIALGGPGAVFWMWCIAIVGMATKYAEAVCAVKYREVDINGKHVGGPMYYIRNGLGKNWAWLAVLFAIFGTLAGFGIGNTVQANSVANALSNSFNIAPAISGIGIMILAALVILGGIQRIAHVAGILVPGMALLYVSAALIVIIANASEVPASFMLIFKSAFSDVEPIAGGFAGAVMAKAISYGIARGLFSNEAGLGSAPIAHAAAQTNDPVKQGTIAMLGTFIDTIVICTLTALVILSTGAWTGGQNGAALSILAFDLTFPGFGGKIVSIAMTLFAFTTILGWSFYGERCAQYLLGPKAALPYRILWIALIPVGAFAELDMVWVAASILNALMALPNLTALLLLSPVIFKMTHAALSSHSGSSVDNKASLPEKNV